MEKILTNAIETVQHCEFTYCKFLSANDTKSTRSHQSGYLVSKAAWQMFLSKEPTRGQNIKADITIKWQDDFETNSTFTYYGAAKDEFRLTNFGRGFPFREESNTGDLFILCKIKDNYFKAYILGHDDDIDDFFAAVNISATDTNKLISGHRVDSPKGTILQCFLTYLRSLATEFPTTKELALNARNCHNNINSITTKNITSNPDRELLSWLDAEFQLFKTIENDRYSKRIETPFQSVEELVETANTILNRRKSRAGKSLEHHLSEIFKNFSLAFATQAVTEDNKKPDFLFPGKEAYHNYKFDEKKLILLASKTTCKDRWRQVLNEADRIKVKHLFTLQQGISKNQLEEMYKYNVRLVVPKPYIESFPEDFRNKILSLDAFIKLIQKVQLH